MDRWMGSCTTRDRQMVRGGVAAAVAAVAAPGGRLREFGGGGVLGAPMRATDKAHASARPHELGGGLRCARGASNRRRRLRKGGGLNRSCFLPKIGVRRRAARGSISSGGREAPSDVGR